MKSIIKNGQIPCIKLFVDIPATLVVINMTIPMGGVISAIVTLNTTMTPKCTGSTPKAIAKPLKIGVSITKIEVVSIMQPNTKSNIFIVNKIIAGFSEMPMKNAVSC